MSLPNGLVQWIENNVLLACSRRDAGREINDQQIEPECGLRNSGCAVGRTCCCAHAAWTIQLRSLPVVGRFEGENNNAELGRV